MNRLWKTGFGSLLALSLALGCRHTSSTQPASECSTCTANATPAQTKESAPRLALVPAPQALAPTNPTFLAPATPSPVAPRTLPNVTSAPVNPTPQPAPPVNSEQSAPPQSPWGMPKAEIHSPVPTPAAVPSPAAMPVPTATPIATPAPTNSPSAPQYYNSPDYSILFGVLDFNARSKTWRLRYADAGDEDRYGGCVTLDGVGRQMEGYASGQFVRVEGALANPDSREINPAYRVKEMRPGSPGK